MAKNPASDVLSSDEPSLSALLHDGGDGGNDQAPFSDYECAQILQFQETLYSSFLTSKNAQIDPSSSSSSVPSSSTLHLLPSSSSSSPALKMAATCPSPKSEYLKFSDDSDESCQVICEICTETKESSQMFTNSRCNHSFCSDCVTKLVATKIQENITEVSCPGLDCKIVIELDASRPWLPKDLLDRWDQALCEAIFLATPKFYCPFKDCSVMLLIENEGDGEAIREAECPFCHRLFCARCEVPWHSGADCEEFKKLNEDERGRHDLMVKELAKENKWRRCPNCKFYVERTQGCLHITCRCKYEFCYRCGEQWTTCHGGCPPN